ncbi:hypothetical protein J6590_012978 [Homalodisca vitripennis]|nr:hypothetical protein J6590_012978 [Homalodisca vitripennis]
MPHDNQDKSDSHFVYGERWFCKLPSALTSSIVKAREACLTVARKIRPQTELETTGLRSVSAAVDSALTPVPVMEALLPPCTQSLLAWVRSCRKQSRYLLQPVLCTIPVRSAQSARAARRCGVITSQVFRGSNRWDTTLCCLAVPLSSALSASVVCPARCRVVAHADYHNCTPHTSPSPTLSSLITLFVTYIQEVPVTFMTLVFSNK